MKKVFMFAVSAMMLAACTSNEEVVNPSSEEVRFYSTMTRATDTRFEEGDKISISAVHSSAGTELKVSGNYADNVKYVYRGGLFVAETPSEAIKLPGDGSELAYYAVYPQQYSLAIDGTFKVQTDQRTHASITASDFCTVNKLVSNEKDVVLDFWHRLSRICVNIKGVPAGQTVTMQLRNVYFESKFDLNDNSKYEGTGTKSNIQMGDMGTTIDFEAILPPQAFNIGTNIVITIGGKSYNVTTNRSADTFRSGKEYDYKLRYIEKPAPQIIEIIDPVEVKFGGDIYPWNSSIIPPDELATENPVVNPDDENTDLPNFGYTVTDEGGWYAIRLDMTGVRDPFTNDWVKLYGTLDPHQNVWLSIDNKKKGFTISNTADADGAQQIKAVDLVFLVDNSGSMSEEANTLATQVMAWATKLSKSGLDIRFGCVGYDGAISGAINLTTIDELTKYLSNGNGVARTRHFDGVDASELKSKVEPYRTGGGDSNECGAAALRFADEQFTFRAGANRVYVNFTDEPNQPNKNPAYSTEWVKDVKNWPATKGTIHTVYSSGNNWSETINRSEYPWNLSTYTGGTVIYTSSSFSGVNLDDLPVTGALQNSYIIRFRVEESLFDGKEHDVHITVKSESPKGWILADKVYKIIFVKQ